MAMESIQLVARTHPSRPLHPEAREIRLLRLQPDEYGTEISCTIEIVSLDHYFWSKDSSDLYYSPHKPSNNWTHNRYPAMIQYRPISRPCQSQYRSGRGKQRYICHAPGGPSSVGVLSCSAQPCQCFEAVSYVWGPWDEDRSITLSGQSGFKVTNNLFSALQRLRHTDRHRLLWIDAICINQGDLEERAQQVRIIAEIFGLCWNMIVWLGETSIALPSSKRHLRDHPSQDPETFRAALAKLLPEGGSRWWQRMWTFPEVVASGTETPPEVVLGPIRTTWNEFLLAIVGEDFAQPLRFQDSLGSRPSILDTVRLARLRVCGDARDYVYSLLGIINADEAALITANYSPCFTAAIAFTDATSAIILTRTDLHVLAYVTCVASRQPELPSWAIDFSDRTLNPEQRFANVPEGRPPCERWMPKDRRRRARNITPSIKSLCARGMYLDRILACVSLTDREIGMYYGEHCLAPRLSDVIRRRPVHDPYCTLAWQNAQESMQSLCIETCQDDHKSIDDTINASSDSDWDISPFDFGPTTLEWHALLNAIDRFGTTELLPNSGECFFVTEAGFNGVGFGGVHEGDTVALLYGSNFPAILRQEAKAAHYTFHGLADISGIANGKLIDRVPDLELPEIDFEIR